MDRKNLQRALGWGLGVGLAGVFAFGLWLYANAPSSDGPPADFYALSGQRGGELPVLWDAPKFSFTAHDGAKVDNQTLAGHVWIADFIFTRCTTVCPLITAQMTLLQGRLTDPALRFVSFSVDPEHDTPKALAEYAMKWSAQERRWLLLATDPKGLEAVASGMKVAVMPSDDAENPIIHSNLFLLVDEKGQVRGAYNSSDRDALVRLEQDTRRLLRDGGPQQAAPAPTPADGAQLFAAYKCGACHDEARVAPPLAGLAGRVVAFEDGGQHVADAAYVKESILTPGAHIVAGYLPLMPPYDRELSDAQANALVAYVSQLEGPRQGTVQAAAEFGVDPICKMKVRAAPETLHSERGGQTFYFCSDTCKERFDAQAPDNVKP